jgi:hypothetical protein
MLELTGTVENGAIKLDSDVALPEGARVTVVLADKPCESQEPSLPDFLLSIAGTVSDWPTDMAVNHDHYLHGAAKRTPETRHE